MLPNSLNIKYQGSLCCRCILTLVSNICKAALISLFWAPVQSMNYWHFEFPLNMIGKWTTLIFMAIFNSPVLARTQILIHTRGAQNEDFAAVLQTDLRRTQLHLWYRLMSRALVQSFITETKSEMEATKKVHFLLAFKCMILQ